MYRLVLIGCLAPALLAAGKPAAGDPVAQEARSVMARMPLRFEANKGQFDPSIRYAARTSEYTVALTAHGASMVFSGSPRISLSLDGSAASAAIQPENQLAVRTDYMIGPREKWHTGVANYTRVRYRAVYPGIDMVFYGSENRLEYDFVLQPGADPNAIRMNFSGAGKLTVTAEGDLALETPGGRMLQHRPLIYQGDKRRAVNGRYTLLADGRVGVQVDGYDRDQPLVIDPIITYTTLLGGGGTETMAGFKIQKGLVYVVGSTATGDWAELSTDNPYNAQVDSFIMIIDTTTPGGYSVKYFSYLGGTGNDTPMAMDVDDPGFIYVTGQTTSTDYPMQGNELGGIVSGNTTQRFRRRPVQRLFAARHFQPQLQNLLAISGGHENCGASASVV